MRASLRPVLVLLVAAGAAALSGCVGGATSSTNVSCVNDQCTITLQGEGADVEFGSADAELELETASEADGVAAFTIDDETATCGVGQTVAVAGFQATCTEIGDARLVVQVVG